MPRIPSRYLFVWTGRRFPYHARLAIESTLIADSDAEVELYLFGARPDDDAQLAAIAGLARVKVDVVDEARAFAGLPDAAALARCYAAIPPAAASARANLIRYAVLHRRGGIYLDLDILVVRSLAALRALPAFVGEEDVWTVDEHRVRGDLAPWMIAPTLAWAAAWAVRRLDTRLPGGAGRLEPVARRLDARWSTRAVNNAVIGAPAGSPLIERLLAAALTADPMVRYALGPTLITRVTRDRRDDVVVLPPAVLYPVPPAHSFRFFDGGPLTLPDEAVLIHYVASNHRALLADLDEAAVWRHAARGTFWQLAARTAEQARSLPRRTTRWVA